MQDVFLISVFVLMLGSKHHNRGADRRRGPHKQTQFDCAVHGVRSSTLFWRGATGQGT